MMSSHNYSTDEPTEGEPWDDTEVTAAPDYSVDGNSTLTGSDLPSLNGTGPPAVPPLPPLPHTDPPSIDLNVDGSASLNGVGNHDGAPNLDGLNHDRPDHDKPDHEGLSHTSSNGSAPAPDIEQLAAAAGLSSDQMSQLGLVGGASGDVGVADETPEHQLFEPARPPARRVLHPFDVSPEPVMANQPSVGDGESIGSMSDFEQMRSEPPVDSGRGRAPITDEVPIVAPPPAPHTSSSALISGGIGDAPVGDPVDQIAVRKLGGFNFLSIPQWMALPRDEKARLIKGELVTFMYEGEEVSLRAALLFLQSLNRDDGDRPNDRW